MPNGSLPRRLFWAFSLAEPNPPAPVKFTPIPVKSCGTLPDGLLVCAFLERERGEPSGVRVGELVAFAGDPTRNDEPRDVGRGELGGFFFPPPPPLLPLVDMLTAKMGEPVEGELPPPCFPSLYL